MKALFYLHKRMLLNSFKRSVRKPAFIIMTVFAVVYFGLVLSGYKQLFNAAGITEAKHFVILIMVVQMYFGIPGVLGYFKRKGLLFRRADVQYVFQTPIHPKKLLMFAGIKSVFTIDTLMVLTCVFACYLYPSSALKFIFYTVLFIVLDFFIEMSLVVICFGNETIDEKLLRYIAWVAYILLGILLLGFIWQIYVYGYSMELLMTYLELPIVKMIPLFGWSIALIQWIFYGANISNIVGTVLYVLSAVILPVLAYYSKCEGDFFEDAEKFADDYEEAIEKSKQGEIAIIGKKRHKYVKAKVQYKGYYAKAIFYRQLLEYKKQKFFIFSFRTLLFIAIGIGLHYVVRLDGFLSDIAMYKVFVIPVITTYSMTFFSAVKSKWAKELDSYTTFLLPDSKWNKTWNATKLEHVKAFVDTLFLSAIGGTALGLSVLQMILCIFVGVSVNAVRIYLNMLVNTLILPKLGNFKLFAQFIEILLMLVAIIVAVASAVISTTIFSLNIGFICIIVTSCIIASVCFLLSALSFNYMEISG